MYIHTHTHTHKDQPRRFSETFKPAGLFKHVMVPELSGPTSRGPHPTSTKGGDLRQTSRALREGTSDKPLIKG